MFKLGHGWVITAHRKQQMRYSIIHVQEVMQNHRHNMKKKKHSESADLHQCLVWGVWTVREITKSSSNFTATNISSNIVLFLQLDDTIQMKSNYTWIKYNHDNIAIRSHIVIYNFVWNFIFGTKFSSIYLAKGEKQLVFRLSFVNLQRAKDGTHRFDAKYRYVFVV